MKEPLEAKRAVSNDNTSWHFAFHGASKQCPPRLLCRHFWEWVPGAGSTQQLPVDFVLLREAAWKGDAKSVSASSSRAWRWPRVATQLCTWSPSPVKHSQETAWTLDSPLQTLWRGRRPQCAPIGGSGWQIPKCSPWPPLDSLWPPEAGEPPCSGALALPGSRALMSVWRSTKRAGAGKESSSGCNEAPGVQDQSASSPEDVAGSHTASGTTWAKQGR